MNASKQLFVFSLERQRYALHISAVEKVVRAVEINPVPKAPDSVLGIISVRGRIVPVLNIRRYFRRPERDLDLNDRLIIVKAKERLVAFIADDVTGVLECPESAMVEGSDILPEVTYLEGVMALKDGMILIYDLERFLSSDGGDAFTHELSPEDGPASSLEEQEGVHD
jgi:purine-binding chemotaxis protein CheW